MAKVCVSGDLLLRRLFPSDLSVQLRDVSFDLHRDIVTIDLEGPTIPQCEWAVCHVSTQRETITFIECHAPHWAAVLTSEIGAMHTTTADQIDRDGPDAEGSKARKCIRKFLRWCGQ